LLLLQVNIGNAEYHCSCVRYESPVSIELIVGLLIGLGLLLVIVYIIIVVVVVQCRRRQKKKAQEVSGGNVQMSANPNNESRDYDRRLPDESVETNMDGDDDDNQNSTKPDILELTDSADLNDEGEQYCRHLPDDYVKTDL